MLSDRQARARTFGLDSALSTPFWSAVKTGTSKDMRDNWTIGWSQDYTVGVWVGNSSGASMYDITGVSGAGPIWHDVMGYLHQNRPGKAPAMPAGVVAEQVVFEQDLEPSRTEYFCRVPNFPGLPWRAHCRRCRISPCLSVIRLMTPLLPLILTFRPIASVCCCVPAIRPDGSRKR